MKSAAQFLKTTAAGGLMVLFPLLLFYALVAEVMDLLIGLATPIADLFPEGTFGEQHAPVLAALIVLVCASFFFGLLLRSKRITSIGQRIDETIMEKLPAYRAIKSLSRGMFRSGDQSSFHVAVLSSSDGTKELVYVTEDVGGEWVTVLMPWAPAAFAGSLRMVPRASVELVDVSILDASASFANFGVGTLDLLEKRRTNS
jgi:uncharacterized membrane protein